MGCLRSDDVKNAPNIQIQDFLVGPVRRGLKRTTPGGPSVGDQDVQFRFRLLNLFDQSLHLLLLRDVGSDPHGFARDARQGVQFVYGLVDSLGTFGLPRGDEDCFGPRPQKCSRSM